MDYMDALNALRTRWDMAGISVEVEQVRPRPVAVTGKREAENELQRGADAVEARRPAELLQKFDHMDFSEFQKTSQILNSKELRFDPPARELAPNIVDNTPDVTFSAYPGYLDAGFLPDGTPLIADLRYYWGYQGADADFQENGSSCTMFHASTDFLKSAAKEYAKISDTQEFLYRPTMDGQFVNSTIDFFLGDKATEADYQAMYDSIDRIVRELAGRIKNGQSTDMSTLKNKLSIAGEEISINQFQKMQQMSLKLVQGVQDRSFGNCSILEFAEKGLRTAAAGFYGKSLPGTLGEKYRDGFGRLMERSCEGDLEVFRSSNFGWIRDSGAVACSRFGPEAYTLFSGIKAGSKASMKAELTNAMSEYRVLLNKTGFTLTTESCLEDSYQFFDSLIS